MSRRRRRDRSAPQLPDLSGRSFPERDSTDVRPGEPSFVGSTWKVPRPVSSYAGVWGELAPYSLIAPPKVLHTLRPAARRKFVTTPAAPASFLSRQFDTRAFNVLRVEAPARVRFCVQRKSRRGVLFARSLVGFSGSSPGKNGRYRQSKFSEYRC